MSLTIGSGPVSTDSRGVLSTGEVPRGATYAEPYPRRVRALLGGRALLDTDKAWMVHRPGFGAELWFPRDEVNAPGLASTALTEFEQADDPVSRALAGFVKLDFKSADRWFVEDEPVYAEVRDPYHRVEVLSSHRHVTVELDGRLLADTHRPKLLFETGLPVHHSCPGQTSDSTCSSSATPSPSAPTRAMGSTGTSSKMARWSCPTRPGACHTR